MDSRHGDPDLHGNQCMECKGYGVQVEDIIRNKEYALASGAGDVLGHWGTELVIFGALLATSSAISGTMFGA